MKKYDTTILRNGTRVLVTPKDDNPAFEFAGVVIGKRNGQYLVRDQNDDVFQVDSDQIYYVK